MAKQEADKYQRTKEEEGDTEAPARENKQPESDVDPKAFFTVFDCIA